MRVRSYLLPWCKLLAGIGIALLVATTFLTAQDDQTDAVTSTTIPATMFGMSAHDGVLFSTPWPTMAITGMRLWDSHVAWGQINTAKGVYNWTDLDDWVSKAASHNSTLIYTFGYTPGWASS